MNISGKEYEEVIITAEDGEVLAVVSDSEIIEKKCKSHFDPKARLTQFNNFSVSHSCEALFLYPFLPRHWFMWLNSDRRQSGI